MVGVRFTMVHLPDSRIARVAMLLAIMFAAATLLLYVDYHRTRNRVRHGGRTIDGSHVEGSGLSDLDVRSICDALNKTSTGVKLPILSIHHTEPNSAKVYTGEVRGPLDGGGKIILFKRIEGVWTIIDDGVLRGWVS